MISKYKNAAKVQKEYRVSMVKKGISASGKEYTVFSIGEKVGEKDGKGVYENYSVFTWQEGLRIADGDRIVFEDITGIEVKQSTVNEKLYVNKTIFAEIKVVKTSLPPKQPDVIGELPDLTPMNSEDLPF